MVPVWLILSILAALIWAIVNILDKLLMTQHLKSHWTRMTIDSVVGLTTCLPLVTFVEFQKLWVIGVAMLEGVLIWGFNYCYYRAIAISDVAATAAYLQIVPVLSSIWGLLIFKEFFSISVYIGILLVLIGISLVSFHKEKNSLVFDFSVFLSFILPGAFLLSWKYVIQKNLLVTASVWDVFFWARIGCFLMSIFMITTSSSIAKDLQKSVASIPNKALLGVGLIEWLNFSGIIALIYAYSDGPITLVTTVAAIQPLFVFVIVIVFGVQGTNFLSHESQQSSKFLLIRIAGILAQISGIFLIGKLS